MENINGDGGQMCTQCEDINTAVKFCDVCKEYMCIDCTNAHTRTKITKDHKLTEVNQEKNKIHDKNSATEFKLKCRDETHAGEQVTHFCTDCEREICARCLTEEHVNHNVKSLIKEFQDKHAVLSSLVCAIKQTGIDALTKKLNDSAKQQREKGTLLKGNISSQFEIYSEIIKERCAFLKTKIDQETENVTSRLQKDSALIDRGKSILQRADVLLAEKTPAVFLHSSQTLIAELKEIQEKLSQLSDIREIHYNQACTTDDFRNIVQALGSIQQFGPDICVGGEESPSTTRSQSIPSLPNERNCGEQLMSVLKSLTTHDRSQLSYKAGTLDSQETLSSVNNEMFVLRNLNKTTANEIPSPASLVVQNIPLGRLNILDSDVVRSMVAVRFQTWGLKGHWTVEGGRVEMFSRTQGECEQCMQLLKESVLGKTVNLTKGSEFIVESDKWQMTTSHIKTKYPDQVEIAVNHEDGTVEVYATCTTILNDSCDAIRIFLRDNQLRTITLRYDEPVVTYVMRSKRMLDSIKTSFSQFCLQILGLENRIIRVSGIGFSLGQAVRRIHAIALKCTKVTDENRFDSDHDSDNDDDRFSDDEQVEANVEMSLNVVAEGNGIDITALCFPGDDRTIYVVAGDIMALPVDGLVNAADKSLKHNGGLAKAIVQKGGRSIQEECTDHVQKHGTVPEGQVFCSGPGNLPCTVIIHAVGPKWSDGTQDEEGKLYECVTNCLVEASRRRISSLAFPAISSGTFRCPLSVATSTITKAVKEFLQKHPVCCIREIYLCDRDVATVKEFVISLQNIFRDSDFVISMDAHAAQKPDTGEKNTKTFDIRPLLVI